jgi:hypothetical protein
MTIPADRSVGYMLGALDAPVAGDSYAITGGTAASAYSIGAADSVVEVLTSSYVAGTLLVHKTSLASPEDYTITIDISNMPTVTSSTLYVDAINGSNHNTGSMLDPLSSLDLASELIISGGTVLLYSSFYGSRTISEKPCTIKGLFGHTPIFNNLAVLNGTSLVADNLTLRGGGIAAQSGLVNRTGSITVRNCFFTGTSAALVDSYKYVSILQNTIIGDLVGLQLTNLQEATVSSNIIYNTTSPNAVLAVSALNVDRMDFRHNTVNEVDKIFFSDEVAIGFFKSVEVTLTGPMILAKNIVLAGSGFVNDSLGNKAVAVTKEDGTKCTLLVDYTIVGGNTISWSGLALEPLLSVGSKLVILYQMASGGPVPGINSGIDVMYQEVTQDVIDSKHVILPVTNLVIDENNRPLVAVNTISGETQNYGLDYAVVGNEVTWEGYDLDGRMILGDYIRVLYSYGTSLYKLDSNSLTTINSIDLTTRFTATVTYNNLYNTPLVATGTNIAVDPLYTNASTGDLMPLMASPNIASANPAGVGPLYNHNTTYINDKDSNGADRAFKGTVSDRGALDNLSIINTRTESILSIGQQGFDEVYDGDESRPLRRLSRAFSDVSGDPINFIIGPTTPGVSDRKMYFDDHSLDLNNSSVSIDPSQNPVPKVLKRDTAFVQPFDTVGYVGVTAYVATTGDDLTGDGTAEKPYRTIDKALATTATVIVAVAGSYPLFTGVAGKKVVFIPRVDSYTKGAFATSTMSEYEWIVLDTSGSIPTFTPTYLYVRHP